MKFYKYRQNFASHLGEWVYCIDNGFTVEEIEEELSQVFGWSEHYRGCDIEKNIIPPLEWLKKENESIKKRIKYLLDAERITARSGLPPYWKESYIPWGENEENLTTREILENVKN